MKLIEDVKLDFKDVLFRPKHSELSSRADVDLEREYIFKHSGYKWTGIPIIASNMDTVGTFETYEVLSKYHMLTCFHKYYDVEDFPVDKLDRNYYMVSIGIHDHDLVKLEQLVKRLDPQFVCIDVANGYSTRFVQFVKKVRALYPKITLVAGNVVTNEMVEELVLNCGVDIVKCGIGNGSVCLTRIQSGVGYPQLSAVMECSDAAHGLAGHIISDGGAVNPGDIAKAMGGGADFVMLGSMFAGHDESGGEMIEENGKKYKAFYGMSSDTAMNKYHGGVAKHRSSEGKTVKTPYRGPLEGTVQSILGGIRSTCTYIGARRLKDISKCTTFIRVNRQVNDVYGHENLWDPKAN